MILVLLGPPGAGKGTQAKVLEEKFGMRQISTGDILRHNRRMGTPLGKEAQSFMDAGQLVPDDLIIRMMEPELASDGGKLLDGFPRTVAQAEALDALLVKHGADAATAILFSVDIDVMKERVSGRWTNPRTGRTYHDKFNPPKVDGVDDEDGGPLVQRDDDKPEAVATRLDVYEKQTTPLIGYYEKSGRLAKIDALAPIAGVSKEIVALVEGVKSA